jgi:hypothetical protein
MKIHFDGGPWDGIEFSADHLPHKILLEFSGPDTPIPHGKGMMLSNFDLEHTYTLEASADEQSEVVWFKHEAAKKLG